MNDIIQLSILLKAHSIEHELYFGVISLSKKNLEKVKVMLTSKYLNAKFRVQEYYPQTDSKAHITFYSI